LYNYNACNTSLYASFWLALLEANIIKNVTTSITLGKTKHPVINHQQQEQRHHHHPEQSNVNDPLLDRKIEDVA
jgi:hypothetical protein